MTKAAPHQSPSSDRVLYVDPLEDRLAVSGLTIRGVGCGGICTCLMVPELGLMFDVAPRIAGQLRYDTILVSHGHQDHLGGLPYLVAQRHLMGSGPVSVHLPQEILAPMERVFEAWREIEDFSLEVDLHGHQPGDSIPLPTGAARCVRSIHRVPSLAWIIERHTERLRPALVGRPGAELAARRRAGEPITQRHVVPLLCVTGDTQIELFDREPLVRECSVLVHEVTSWDDRRSVEQVRQWGHTHVDEVVERAERFTGDALILIHRSPRHTKRDAQAIVNRRFPASMRDKVHVFGN